MKENGDFFDEPKDIAQLLVFKLMALNTAKTLRNLKREISLNE